MDFSSTIYIIYFWLLFSVLRKRQINKPRPVSEIDMEAIFKKAKEEQEKHEKEFEEEQQQGILNSAVPNVEPQLDSKPKQRSRKSSDPLKLLTPGSTVRVVSGNFVEFEGNLKKVNRKTRKVCDAVL